MSCTVIVGGDTRATRRYFDHARRSFYSPSDVRSKRLSTRQGAYFATAVGLGQAFAKSRANDTGLPLVAESSDRAPILPCKSASDSQRVLDNFTNVKWGNVDVGYHGNQ